MAATVTVTGNKGCNRETVENHLNSIREVVAGKQWATQAVCGGLHAQLTLDDLRTCD